jgi:ParB family chromosome partitioning protein
MSKKDFSESVKKTIEEPIPEGAFEIGKRDVSTSGQVIRETKGLKGARVIDIEKIQPDPHQPRKSLSEDSLKELAESIKAHGILQPVSVEHIPNDGLYKIIAGERRFQAAKLAGLTEIPCVVLEEVATNRRKAIQLVENLQREDLSPVDKARGILEFKELVGSWEEVDRLTGLSPRRRQQFTALLKLPDEIQKDIISSGRRPAKAEITEKHARALLALRKEPERQKELFELMTHSKKPLTGDEAVLKAREFKGEPVQRVLSIRYTSEEDLIHKLETELRKLKENLKKRT